MTNWQPLHDELSLWQSAAATPSFWWRDDDAVSDTPQLRTLLSIAGQLPLVLAVVPGQCVASLPALLASWPAVSVIQHGWRHAKHFNQTAEYPTERKSEKVYEEIRAGKYVLTELFGDRFVPAFAPPYHVFSPDFVAILEVLGFTGFSVIGTGPAAPLRRLRNVNVHIAPINWSTPPTLGNTDTIITTIVNELRQRRTSGDSAPIGLLTHHLAHDATITAFVQELVAILVNRQVAFRTARSLFG